MGNRQAKIKHFELNEKVGQIKQIFLLKIFKLMRDILWNFILMFTYARTHIRKHLHKPVKRAGMRGHRSDCPLYVHVRANVYVCVCGRLFTQNCSPNRSSSSWSVWMEEREKITGLNSLQYVCSCECVLVWMRSRCCTLNWRESLSAMSWHLNLCLQCYVRT